MSLVVWTALVACSGALWGAAVLALARMRLDLRGLLDFPDVLRDGQAWPTLSVIVPARNEERRVEEAVRSLLTQDYPGLEVVAVDDRSTDGTGTILDRLARESKRLTVIHVHELPDGWLGKSHACHVAAARARGEWCLFTDADICFARGTLRRAIATALRLRVAHLVALPAFLAPGLWERAYQAAFFLGLALKLRTWELSRPHTRAFVGAGAFNLVRSDAYARVGGHERLRLEVVEDLKLGLVLRRSGVPQAAVESSGLVSVRWQEGFRASLSGLMKNAFAGCEWRWGMLLLVVTVLALLALVPAAGALLAPPPLAAVAAGVLATSMLVHGLIAREGFRGTGFEGVLFPACGLLLMLVLLASALLAWRRGGIRWRDTHYALDDLRAGCVREADWPVSAAVGWPPA